MNSEKTLKLWKRGTKETKLDKSLRSIALDRSEISHITTKAQSPKTQWKLERKGWKKGTRREKRHSCTEGLSHRKRIVSPVFKWLGFEWRSNQAWAAPGRGRGEESSWVSLIQSLCLYFWPSYLGMHVYSLMHPVMILQFQSILHWITFDGCILHFL